MPDFLFTYGTLMRSFKNAFANRLRNEATFIGSGSFPGMLYLVSWYPGATFDESAKTKVYGEIYDIGSNQSLLKDLDEYEDVMEDGEQSLYLRKKIPVLREDGSILLCWTYLYNLPVTGFPIIENGQFR